MEWASEIINQLANLHISIALLASFVTGLFTSFNPCMLGMASSVIAFQDESRKKSVLPIALTFMISFMVTFTVLGVVSVFFGEQVLEWTEKYGETFHHLLAVVFVIIGCYMIGFRFRHLLRWLPFKIVSFYSKQGNPKRNEVHQPLIKAYSLGTLFGLTPSPCTTPMILAMIAYTSVTGSISSSALLLLVYGIGHGISFLIIGWMAGALKSTGWMERWHQILNKGIGVGLMLISLYFFLE